MKRKEAGLFGGTVAIAAIVTAGFPWQNVLLGWLLGAVLVLLVQRVPGGHSGRLPALVTVLGGLLVLAAAAMGAEDAFPEDSTFPFVSLALMLLTFRAMVGERSSGGAVANIIGMILLPLLAVTVLFGLRDVEWHENIPQGLQWGQVWVTAAAAAPWWCFRRGAMEKRSWLWFAGAGVLALGMSMMTRGILGTALCGYEEFPLYRAVQTIRILGAVQRLEALLAAVILMGAFSVMLLTGEKVADALDELLPEVPMRWKGSTALALAFCAEWAARTLERDLGNSLGTVFWGLVPVLALWVVFTEKIQKSVENA